MWVVPIALIPYLFWKRREDRTFRIQAIVAVVFTLVALIIIVKNFSPTYAATAASKGLLAEMLRRESFYTIRRITSVFLVAFWLSLPALLAAVPLCKQLKRRDVRAILVIWAIVLPFLLVSKKGIVPFLGNILDVHGIIQDQVDGIGFRPILLDRPMQYGLTILFALVLVTWGVFAFKKQITLDLFRKPAGKVFIIFLCGYIPILIPDGLTTFIFDRHAMPFFPLVALCLLYSLQTRISRIPATSYVCLAIFASYAVITTHDYAAALRARAQAATSLVQRGIPKNVISAGFEHDGWLQLETVGKIGTMLYDKEHYYGRFWFWYFTTALQHDYVTVSYRLDDAVSHAILQVPFTTWTYPFHRKMVMLKQSDVPPYEAAASQSKSPFNP